MTIFIEWSSSVMPDGPSRMEWLRWSTDSGLQNIGSHRHLDIEHVQTGPIANAARLFSSRSMHVQSERGGTAELTTLIGCTCNDTQAIKDCAP